MTKLPSIKPKQAAKVATKLEFELVRQRGSHAIYEHPDGRRVTIPMSRKDIPSGTLNSIIKKGLGISREEFLNLLK